jgi:hypothetical protein
MSYLRRKESGLCLRKDRRRSGFAWIDCSDRDQSVVSYRRRHGEDELVVVVNATPEPRVDYRIGAPASRALGREAVDRRAGVRRQSLRDAGLGDRGADRLSRLSAVTVPAPPSALLPGARSRGLRSTEAKSPRDRALTRWEPPHHQEIPPIPGGNPQESSNL